MNPLLKFGTITLFAITLAYGAYQARFLLTGPEITLDSPADGTIVAEEAVKISGLANNITKLYLNGRQIFTDAAGHFNEEFLLAYGYNVVEIVAEDKFGRAKKETVSLVFK